MALKTYLENLGFTPKRSSSADGGEYSSGCPGCGDGGKGKDSDRFRIWPAKENKGGLCVGRFWCRRCDVSGDTIEFLKKFHNMDFIEACNELGVTLPDNNGYSKQRRFQPTPEQKKQTCSWVPKDYGIPSSVWQAKGYNFMMDCHKRLLASPDKMEWLAGRGITELMIKEHLLGYNVSSKGKDRYRHRKVWDLPPKMKDGRDKKLWLPQGWVIPAFDQTENHLIQLRIRRRNEDIAEYCERIKYFPIDGSSMATMIIYPKAEIFAVVECGFDAFLIAGLFGGKVGVITTWNSSARPDVHVDKVLQKSLLILNLLDYDKGGDDQQDWWIKTYPQNFRPPAPSAGADPGEAFEEGVDLYNWLVGSLPRGMRLRLGFNNNTIPKNLPAKQIKPEPEKEKEVGTVQPVVDEVVLSNGYVILLTDNRAEYDKLKAAGKAVFTTHEINELRRATSKMSDEDRIDFAMKTIEVKTMFCGEVSQGRVVEVEENDT